VIHLLVLVLVAVFVASSASAPVFDLGHPVGAIQSAISLGEML
jgi:hypothetical protein